MALESGERFGTYEIGDPIGSGGMGEVYRATDTKLKREVALKVLPQAFVEDADRLARFQREAEILASLNHPNIAQVHGLEESDSQTAIVMELVDGLTLADLIKDGPLRPDEAMGIALQVVAALEAAHDKGIVHRDLKPANVKVRDDGTVKVLDFGISKPIDASAISGGSPVAATPAVTETGVILGTAAYMSPEQARGKFVDQRTDIWAFGCLLFEMLTGQPAFGGEDVMLTLARVLANETNLDSIPGTISPAVRHTIRLCLEKDPRKRFHHIGDVRLALEGTFETQLAGGTAAASRPAARPGWRRALPLAAGVAAVVLAAAAVWSFKPEAPGIVTRFDYVPPDDVLGGAAFSSLLDIAPNGEFFVFIGDGGIYLRWMDDPEARLIPGTEGPNFGVSDLVVAPDSRAVAYFRNAGTETGQFELVRIAVGGGQPEVVAGSLSFPYGLSWEADGTMLFGQSDGVWRAPDGGGTPQALIETEAGEQVYGPQLLPGGEWVLFTLTRSTAPNRWNEAEIVVESLATGERRVLRQGGSDARYLPTGHLTYLFENDLYASTFDPRSLEVGDDRDRLVQDVQAANVPPPFVTQAIGAGGGAGHYAVSDNGTLIYRPGRNEMPAAVPETAPPGIDAKRNLVWADREGNEEPLPLAADAYTTARISPDGRRVALVVGALPRATPPGPADIWIFDLETENRWQLTTDPARDDSPVWSPDSSTIYFRSYRDGGDGGIYSVSADGGEAKPVFSSPDIPNPGPWSMPDERTLLFIHAATLSDADIVALDIETSEIMPLLDDDEILVEPSLSSDGEWLLYYLDPSEGQRQVYLRTYPDVDRQIRPVVSGLHPVFSADGSDIFFFDGGGLSVVSVVRYAPLQVSNSPAELFRGEYWYGVLGPSGSFGRAWDVDPIEDRFLMITMPEEPNRPQPGRPQFQPQSSADAEDDNEDQPRISVVLNWFNELRERVRP